MNETGGPEGPPFSLQEGTVFAERKCKKLRTLRC